MASRKKKMIWIICLEAITFLMMASKLIWFFHPFSNTLRVYSPEYVKVTSWKSVGLRTEDIIY